MALNNTFRKPKQNSRSTTADPALLAHLQALGLARVEEYLEWCARHGFSRRLDKSWRQRLKERAWATRAAAEARLARKKDERRSPETVIEGIFRGRVREADVTQPQLQLICRGVETIRDCDCTRTAYKRLLLGLVRRTELLDAQPVIPAYGRQAGNSFVEALLAVARHAAGWLRPPEEWRPRTHNAGRQFSSLVRHLFARYPVPIFMDAVWFKGNTPDAVRQQHWFRHLGRGENIRTADLPLLYTKRMAHHFLEAPNDYSVEAALRWGQMRALGGERRLIEAVIATRLGSRFEHDEFWMSVLRFFIAHPMLDTAQIGPIVDYIQHQKFTSDEVFVAPGVLERKPPPQPNFSMKGRTPEALLRQVEAWHRTLARSEQPKAEWAPSGIKAFEFLEGSEENGTLKIWSLTELLSAKALQAEGRSMKHCVASYARSCARGLCSIWTLEVESFDGRRKVLTVEVNNAARLICQARGKCNAPPGDKHRALLRRWADQAGLTLAGYV